MYTSHVCPFTYHYSNFITIYASQPRFVLYLYGESIWYTLFAYRSKNTCIWKLHRLAGSERNFEHLRVCVYIDQKKIKELFTIKQISELWLLYYLPLRKCKIYFREPNILSQLMNLMIDKPWLSYFRDKFILERQYPCSLDRILSIFYLLNTLWEDFI